MNKSKHFGKVS